MVIIETKKDISTSSCSYDQCFTVDPENVDQLFFKISIDKSIDLRIELSINGETTDYSIGTSLEIQNQNNFEISQNSVYENARDLSLLIPSGRGTHIYPCGVPKFTHVSKSVPPFSETLYHDNLLSTLLFLCKILKIVNFILCVILKSFE